MQTKNLADEKFKKLAELFPNAVTETCDAAGNIVRAIDKDVLQQEISTVVVEGKEERYQFTWPDKRKSILAANAPTTNTLRPCKEESVNFDTTQNLYIEGDNLEVLKLLHETYLGRVKMIYIDPPYNTGKNFVYKDDFAESTEEYLANSGQYDEEGNRLFQNAESNGRFHTDWLNMLYPRLKIAKDLLTEDGVIFISIDHHEIINLTKICDEIFGISNKMGILSVINNLKGRSDDKYFATCNEFMLAYGKKLPNVKIAGFELEDEELEEDYDKQDEIGFYKLIGLRKTGSGWERIARPYMFYPILYKGGEFSAVTNDEFSNIYVNGVFDDKYLINLVHNYERKGYKVILPTTETGEFGRWRWGRETFELNKELNVELNNSGTLCSKMRATMEDGSIRLKSAKTVWYKPEYDTGSGAKVLKKLFGTTYTIFENPKSTVLLSDLLHIASNKDSMIVDFFSGSATTAHAVMQLNAEDGGNRKFIMVQLPEECDEKSEAFKAGYKNICEIGKERIRRAGKKIVEEHPEAENLDIGFRVLKLDTSNMKEVNHSPAETDKQNILNLAENVKEDRSAEDLLFQIMLELGIELSSSVKEKNISGTRVFDVADNYLAACFEDRLTEKAMTEIAKSKPFVAVFRDSCFETDSEAVNCGQIFKTYSPDTVIKVL